MVWARLEKKEEILYVYMYTRAKRRKKYRGKRAWGFTACRQIVALLRVLIWRHSQRQFHLVLRSLLVSFGSSQSPGFNITPSRLATPFHSHPFLQFRARLSQFSDFNTYGQRVNFFSYTRSLRRWMSFSHRSYFFLLFLTFFELIGNYRTRTLKMICFFEIFIMWLEGCLILFIIVRNCKKSVIVRNCYYIIMVLFITTID